jgi:hypothetical protein
MGGQVTIKRGELNPVMEHTFRYDVEHSYTAHNTEKRALSWQSGYPRLGNYSDWDWKQTEKLSRALRYHIKKLSISKHEARPILPRAASLHADGKFKLRENW